jgi:meso-butanediol dehydrogenase/(S,S)-butanediol dehydrogenase/diacetyl reductase
VALLNGQRALVTGGGSGIGRATCRRMAAEGARVAVLDRDRGAAEAVAKEIDGRPYGVDVTDADAMKAAVDDAASAMGGLTTLFNNAGIGSLSPLHEWSLEEWDQLVRVNLTGVFLGFKTAVPHLLKEGGCIVSTSSISGVRPAAGEAAYAAAKAGVVALTASAALEYGPRLRVNAVAPGMIRTALTEPLLEVLPEAVDRYVATTPVARLGEPDDVAEVVVFLCSDMARFVNGQNIVVDGGMTLHGSGVDGVFERLFSPRPHGGDAP